MILIVLAAFINLLLTGCYTSKQIQINDYSEQEIEKLITINNDTLVISNGQGELLKKENGSIKFIDNKGDSSSIKHNQIKALIVKEYNNSKSAGIIVASIVGGIILLINILINSIDSRQ